LIFIVADITLVLSYSKSVGDVTIEGAPPPRQGEKLIVFGRSSIDPDYFLTLRVRLIRGRFFNARDPVRATPTAIVNETMARRSWPNQDPIGNSCFWSPQWPAVFPGGGRRRSTQ
jgi:hypothetical protein